MYYDNIYNLIAEESYVLSDEYSLKVMAYGEKTAEFYKCSLIEIKSGMTVYEYEQSCHVKFITKIIRHNNGHKYYMFHTDLYNIRYIDIDTLEVYCIPEDDKYFVITDVFYDSASDLIAYDGIYPPCPDNVMAGDFSNPFDFNPHLISMRDIIDPEYDVYDEISFKEWKNGRLYVWCDFETEKSVGADELKDMINKLTIGR